MNIEVIPESLGEESEAKLEELVARVDMVCGTDVGRDEAVSAFLILQIFRDRHIIFCHSSVAVS